MVQVYYLDEFVDVMTYNLIGRHAKKDLEVFDGKGVWCTCHCKASVVPDTGRHWSNLLQTQSSLETKKNRDFQYLKDEGRSVTIVAFLTQGTS